MLAALYPEAQEVLALALAPAPSAGARLLVLLELRLLPTSSMLSMPDDWQRVRSLGIVCRSFNEKNQKRKVSVYMCVRERRCCAVSGDGDEQEKDSSQADCEE